MTRRQVSDNRWRLGERFDLLGQLGSGAAGTVWRALDLTDGGEHAVKVLRPELVTDAQAVTELYSALDSAARVRHPGVVAFDDAATGPGWLALRSRLVAGESLRSYLQRRSAGGQEAIGPDPAAQALATHVIAQVCAAVAAAHAAGVVHGDLHPGNVLLGGAAGGLPNAVVTDFGLAGLVNRARGANAAGSVPPAAYRAPEAGASGDANTSSADIYSIGVMLFECLTGLAAPTPLPHLPGGLWAIIVACITPDPRYRPTAAQLATSLRTAHAAGPARPIGAPQAGPRPPAVPAPVPVPFPDSAAEQTRLLNPIPGFGGIDEPAYAPSGERRSRSGSRQERGQRGNGRLTRLVVAHKTESGIAAALVVAAALIAGALSLGGGGASVSTAGTRPAGGTAAASPRTGPASQTPQAVILPVGSAVPSPSPTPSPAATGPLVVTLVNSGSKTCLDTAGRSFADGTKEDLFTCNGTPAQSWTLTPAGQLTEDGGAFCLDDYGLQKTPGTPVVLWNCNGGPNQRWTIANGAIVSANAGLCIDASGKATADGTPLVLWPCDGSASQQWSGR
jgi:serine/threonine-protein kinase